MNKKEVFDLIQNKAYDFPHKERIFDLLENHLERIEFVKDHIGLRDFLFMGEKGTEPYFDHSLFIAINVDFDKEAPLDEKEQRIIPYMITNPHKILSDLEAFFYDTERTLYVGFGFKESTDSTLKKALIPMVGESGHVKHISLYDIILSISLREKKIDSIEDGIRQLRRFPSWFHDFAKMPEEYNIQTINDERNEYDNSLKKQKEEVLESINILLSKAISTLDDEASFKQLSVLYKTLNEIK